MGCNVLYKEQRIGTVMDTDWSNYDSIRIAIMSEYKNDILREIDKIDVTPEWTGQQALEAVKGRIRRF